MGDNWWLDLPVETPGTTSTGQSYGYLGGVPANYYDPLGIFAAINKRASRYSKADPKTGYAYAYAEQEANRNIARGFGYRGVPSYANEGRTESSIYSMGPNQRAQVKSAMRDAGLLKGSFGPAADDATVSAWGRLLASANQQGLTWEGALSRYANGAGPGAGPSGSGPSGPVTTTSTQRIVNLTGFETADQLLDAASTTLLGRQMNDSEVRAFKARLNRAESADPTVVTSTTTTSGRSSSTSTRTNQSDIDPGQHALRDVKKRDKAEAQGYAKVNYMTTLEQLFGGVDG